MRKIFSFFSGLFLGGLIGAVTAMLLAPGSGEEMRAQLQERTIQLRDDIKAVAETRRAELERELAALRAPYQKE